MEIRFAIFIFICAICVSLVSKIFVKQEVISDVDESIFVCIISYCDSVWLQQVEQIIQTANNWKRIHFGIIEYVENAEDSQEDRIPNLWRNNIRVYTVSRKVAVSQCQSRKLCFTKLYRDEDFVLFTKSVEMENGWDNCLLKSMINDSIIVTMHLDSETSTPAFPCLSVKGAKVDIKYKPLVAFEDYTVPILLWSSDFVFSKMLPTQTLLQSLNPIEMTAALVQSGHELCMCTQPIAKRAAHPIGVKDKLKRLAITDDTSTYLKSIGVTVSHATAYAQLGLSPNASSNEKIAKYGSVVAARVASQSIDATIT